MLHSLHETKYDFVVSVVVVFVVAVVTSLGRWSLNNHNNKNNTVQVGK